MPHHNSDLLAQIVHNSPIAIFVIDTDHRVTHWNRACEAATGTPAEQVLGTTRAWAAFYPAERPVMADLIIDGRQGSVTDHYSGRCWPSTLLDGAWEAEDFFPHFPDGGKWLAFTATPLTDEDGRIVGAIQTLRDVTADHRAQAIWHEGRHLMHNIIDGSPVPMFVLDEDHQVTHWNRACEALNLMPAPTMIGTRDQWKAFYDEERPVLADLVLADAFDEIRSHYGSTCRPSPLIENAWETTAFFPDFRSGAKWLYITAAPVRGLDGRIIGAVETLQDVTAQKAYEVELEHRTNYDPLTGLANRHLLGNRLQQAIVQAQRDGRMLALLFLDLDNFKRINDTMGHDAGDEVLRAFGLRIDETVRDVDTVARIAGDEYVILLDGPPGLDHVNNVVYRLLDRMTTALTVRGRELYLGCSIGIALYPKDGDTAEILLQNADAAMYRAKQIDKGSFRYYTENMNLGARQWMELKQLLHHALSDGQLELYYQPQFNLRSGQMTGAEALIRWNHPERGLLLPDLFIPIAEETGLIVPIGSWVVRTAVAEARQWRSRTGLELRLAVNISSRQFRYRELLELLERVVDDSGALPLALELEITESLVMADTAAANDLLQKLKAKGFSLAMDDFGTGYSSLAYLRTFPFDMIKIDQSFIADLGRSEEAGAIVRAMLQLGRALGLRIMAEGVETAAQLAFLKAEGCDEAQGFFCCPPLPAAEFLEAVQAHALEHPVGGEPETPCARTQP